MPRPGDVEQAGGVVFRDASGRLEVLVVSTRDRRTWIFPKGHVEDGEDVVEAALREVREESGVVATPVSTLPESVFLTAGRAVPIRYVVARFVEQQQTEEDRERRWVDPDEALALLTHEDTRRVLLAALPVLRRPAERFEDLLLAEYAHVGDALVANEEDGERRVTALLAIAAAAGGIGTMTGRAAVVPLLAGVAVVGFGTFLRVRRRNALTDEYKAALARLRRAFVPSTVDPRRHLLAFDPHAAPARRGVGWSRGGWLPTVIGIEALCVGALAAAIAPGGGSQVAFAVAAAGCALGLVAFDRLTS